MDRRGCRHDTIGVPHALLISIKDSTCPAFDGPVK